MGEQGAPRSDVLRVANCSGFYGDRLSAMREVLEGGEVDVVTGDYLAELTMLILGKDRLKDPSLGYARTFLAQVSDCLGLALERGARIVANAGGLNPAGLVEQLAAVAARQGLSPRIAWVDGDDLAPRASELGLDGALTANAYLGAFGIARALEAGADVVVTGRVTDASVVLGPAIWRFGWTPEQHDQLAGGVVAGHVVECGTQATGGNFSGFLDLPRDGRPLGFPIAEIAADGGCVVTKHPGTGGLVSVDTVTAQLMYEVQSEQYLGPDVTVDLSSVVLEQEGPDRVRVSGVRGSAPPARLKVCVNELGGFRNQLELVLTGLHVAEKAAWVRAQLEPRITASSVTWTTSRAPEPDAGTEESASCLLRCVVKDADAAVVGKPFTAAAVELALASYPGFTMTTPPGRPSPYGLYRAAYVDRGVVRHTVHLPDGSTEVVPDPARINAPDRARINPPDRAWINPPDRVVPDVPVADVGHVPARTSGTIPTEGATRRLPLGTFVHARSGDKGGDANLGLWVGAGDRQAERSAWLTRYVTPERVRELVPEARDLEVEVFALPNLHGVNVLLHDLLGDGVAASTRFDPQAKGLGEWVRSRVVEIPEELQ